MSAVGMSPVSPGSGRPSGSGRPRGRRPRGQDTRADILRAARSEFAAKGFSMASLRGIARAAGVDPALIHHYFASKESLFAEAIVSHAHPDAIAARLSEVPLDQLGHRIAEIFLSVWDDDEGRVVFGALFRSVASNPGLESIMAQMIETQIFARVAAQREFTDAGRRMALVASQLVGLALMRYVVKLPALVAMSSAQLAAAYGPTLQRYLTGDLELPGVDDTPNG